MWSLAVRSVMADRERGGRPLFWAARKALFGERVAEANVFLVLVWHSVLSANEVTAFERYQLLL